MSKKAKRIAVTIKSVHNGRVIRETVEHWPDFSDEAKREILTAERQGKIRQLGFIDRTDLLKRVLSGGELLEHERQFVADLIEGRKAPAHCPPSVDSAIQKDWIAERYLRLRAFTPTNSRGWIGRIEKDVANFYGVTDRYVRKAMRDLSPQRRSAIENEIAKDFAALAEQERATIEGQKAEVRWARETWRTFFKMRNPQWGDEQMERAVRKELERK